MILHYLNIFHPNETCKPKDMKPWKSRPIKVIRNQHGTRWNDEGEITAFRHETLLKHF